MKFLYHPCGVMSDGGTQEGRDAGGWKSLSKQQEGCAGKSVHRKP